MEDSLLEVASEEVAAVAVVSKDKIFEREINYIKNERIKENAIKLIDSIPDYFFTEAASSTGKYHPDFSQGMGGLLRHTKAAVRIAVTLLKNNSIGYKFTDDEKDLILLALIMHDSVKRGIPEEKYTKFDHPILAGNLIKSKKNELTLTEDELNLLIDVVETHMGEWNTDYNGNKVLRKPTNKYERFVHMCDYLSAQKFLEIKFDGDNNIIF